ncbi:hypothetical protein Tco_1051930 [Tanacetum coccineum]
MDTESSRKKIDSSGKKSESSKKRTRAVLGEESVKKQKVEDDAEKAELKLQNIQELDWKTHLAEKTISIIRSNQADGSTKNYKIFSVMLYDFDRQDVLDLYRLVKERFETTSLEGYDILLWGDLITLFEPSEEMKSGKLNWTTNIDIAGKKKYPFTQEMLSRMLSGRLEVDHECEDAFELLFVVYKITICKKKIEELFGYIIDDQKILIKKHFVVTAAAQDQRKCSKSLLLLQ